MHETGAVRSIVEQAEAVAREAGLDASGIRVTIGPFAGISPESFRRHFEVAAGGGPVAHAEVLVGVDAQATGAAATGVVLDAVIVEG